MITTFAVTVAASIHGKVIVLLCLEIRGLKEGVDSSRFTKRILQFPSIVIDHPRFGIDLDEFEPC